ncbi:hypothetical protein ACYATP_02890 [Lactobacillaceae bacterium Melli_B4]
MPISKAKERANKKWNEANKDKNKVYSYRSRAKAFINKYASAEDLDVLEKLISNRRIEINK